MENDLPIFRRLHVGRAVGRAYWLFEAQFLSAIQAQGYDDIRRSDVTVIRCLPETGARVTDLAARAQMTKQGMGKLVNGLEDRGYLVRKADPRDARAQLVKYTAKGQRLLTEAMSLVATIEAEWEDCVGKKRLDEVKQTLVAIADAMGVEDYL